jgi:outer membrane lipoprotein-sorting protein
MKIDRYYILIITILFIACAGSRYTLNDSTLTYEDLFSEIKSDQKKIETFQGNARISVDSETFSGTFNAEVYLNRNDSMLINVEGPFGLDVGRMFIGNSRFIFHNKLDNQFFSGSVADFLNRNFMQFPIKISEVADVFTAKDNLVSMKIVEYNVEGNHFFIHGGNSFYEYRLWIDPHTGHISRIEYIKNKVAVIEKEYKDFAKYNNLYFPTKIIIKRPMEKQAMSVYYSKLKINETLDSDKFSIRISDKAQQFNVSLQ